MELNFIPSHFFKNFLLLTILFHLAPLKLYRVECKLILDILIEYIGIQIHVLLSFLLHFLVLRTEPYSEYGSGSGASDPK